MQACDTGSARLLLAAPPRCELLSAAASVASTLIRRWKPLPASRIVIWSCSRDAVAAYSSPVAASRCGAWVSFIRGSGMWMVVTSTSAVTS